MVHKWALPVLLLYEGELDGPSMRLDVQTNTIHLKESNKNAELSLPVYGITCERGKAFQLAFDSSYRQVLFLDTSPLDARKRIREFCQNLSSDPQKTFSMQSDLSQDKITLNFRNIPFRQFFVRSHKDKLAKLQFKSTLLVMFVSPSLDQPSHASRLLRRFHVQWCRQ
ncbi:MAG: hypothetical protein MHM6MM_009337, partial [Cercozoa sp. M6MM]